MRIPETIAIDGPAASGKSTVGMIVAKDLGYICLDTGIMYRAVTLAALQRNISIDDEASVTHLAEQIKIDVLPASVDDSRQADVLIDGMDVTWEIRSAEVNANVSQVSAYKGVRDAMTLQQRRIGKAGKVVMLGRDIGSVVLPDADLKVYLDASVEERARRRNKENIERGMPDDLATILVSLQKRDKIDSTRSIAPLTIPDNAVVINTDHLSVQEVVSRIKSEVFSV